MISLPSGPHTEQFRWQFDLFWYCHKRIYGPDAYRRVNASIVKRDDAPSAPRIETLQWPTDMPHALCESYFDLGLAERGRLQNPLNIQACLLQQLPSIPDDTLVELIDADMCHIRPAPVFEVGDNELIVDHACEDWYLKSKGAHRHVIEPYLENGGDYNGGFVPVIGKAKTFKALLPRWIDVHNAILKRPLGDDPHWWARVYALSAACENARVRMIGKDLCYFPGFNTLQDHHYLAHYNVDKVFDKKRFPAVDRSKFPDNVFYNLVRDWMDTQHVAQTQAPTQTHACTHTPDSTQRLAEALLLGHGKESIRAGNVGKAVLPAEFDTAIARIEADPIFKAATRVQQLQHKLESLMDNLQKVQTWSPRYARVDKRTSPSRDEFIERYVLGSRPVVLTDVARDWPAMQRWSPEYFKDRFGHLMVDLQDGRLADRRYEEGSPQHKHKRTVRMDWYVDCVLNSSETNDHDMRGQNHTLSRPGYQPLLADIGTLPEFCTRLAADRCLLWFGPAGTVAPLHHDAGMLFHTQVLGRKRWRLISPLETPKLYNYDAWFSPIDVEAPDLERYPLFKDVTVLDVTLEPGDTLFVPAGWWHHVRSLSVAISLTNLNVPVPPAPFRLPALADWVESIGGNTPESAPT